MSARPMHRLPAAFAVLALLAGCTPATDARHWASVRELTPAGFAGRPVFDPGLVAGPGGRLALTWVTRDSLGADVWLCTSADSGTHFSPPLRLNARPGKVSSFPESRPVAAFGPGGTLVVAWAAARDTGRMADDVVTRASDDGGATFAPETILNDDLALPASTYHGFIGLEVTPRGRALATWIDGRAATLAPGEDEPQVAQVWSAASEDGGRRWGANVMVADSVCPCCRPALRIASSGLVAVAYRGVHGGMRDPHLAVSRDGGATFARDTLLSSDRWALAACPVAGPALTLVRDGGYVAWFSGVRGADGSAPGIYFAPWQAEQGPTSGRQPLAADSLEAAHPMLVSLGVMTLAGVLARPEKGRHALGLRTLAPDGSASPWLFLGANARAATLAGTDSQHAFAAWLEQTEDGPRLRLARISLL